MENKTKITHKEKPNVALSKAASLMGKVKSKAKTEAARINGKKGGRPKKKDSLEKESKDKSLQSM